MYRRCRYNTDTIHVGSCSDLHPFGRCLPRGQDDDGSRGPCCSPLGERSRPLRSLWNNGQSAGFTESFNATSPFRLVRPSCTHHSARGWRVRHPFMRRYSYISTDRDFCLRVSTLTGATVKSVVPKNGTHLTLEDVQQNAVLSTDVHACPTRVISLENTLNGTIMPLTEVGRISEFAREHGIKMHCDGARLWEAVAAGAGTLPEFCAHFDTVSLCLSKGLGAPVGSVLVGPRATLTHSRWVRKSIGGGTRQPGFITACGRVAVDETFGKRSDGSDGWLRASHDMAKKVEALWTDMGGKLVHPVHTNMCWVDLASAKCSDDRFIQLSKDAGLNTSGGRLVTHYQIAQNGDDVLWRLRGVFKQVFEASEELQPEVGVRGMYDKV